MSTSGAPQVALLDGDASRLLVDFAVCQAADLARGGAYDRAESLLRPTVEQRDAPAPALDLQARICAQQGRLGEAGQWWQRVLDKEPANAAAQAALARLNRMQTQPVWLQVAWPVAVGAGAIVCVCLLFMWQAQRQAAAGARLQARVAGAARVANEATQAQIAGLAGEIRVLKDTDARVLENLRKFGDLNAKLESWQANQGMVSGQLKDLVAETKRVAILQEANAQMTSNQVAELHSAIGRREPLEREIERHLAAARKLITDQDTAATGQEGILAPASLIPNRPGPSIEVTGVTTSIKGGSLLLTFNEGLFLHGTYFRADAKSQLQSLAKALGGVPAPLRIQVVGCADDDRAFGAWSARWEQSLALARATSVASYFIGLGLFQPQNITAASSGAGDRPFASDSARSRARNRTVVIRVVRTDSSL